jgi:hypothetical protein
MTEAVNFEHVTSPANALAGPENMVKSEHVFNRITPTLPNITPMKSTASLLNLNLTAA